MGPRPRSVLELGSMEDRTSSEDRRHRIVRMARIDDPSTIDDPRSRIQNPSRHEAPGSKSDQSSGSTLYRGYKIEDRDRGSGIGQKSKIPDPGSGVGRMSMIEGRPTIQGGSLGPPGGMSCYALLCSVMILCHVALFCHGVLVCYAVPFRSAMLVEGAYAMLCSVCSYLSPSDLLTGRLSLKWPHCDPTSASQVASQEPHGERGRSSCLKASVPSMPRACTIIFVAVLFHS